MNLSESACPVPRAQSPSSSESLGRFSQEHVAGLLASAMDGIITVDADQRVVLYNQAAARIFGWAPEDVLGQQLERLLPERFRPGHGDHIARFGRTGVTSRRMGDSTLILGLRRDGEEFPMEASISQLSTPEGRFFTVILRDVSERVRTQAELRDFAAQAHQIREAEKTRIARELHDELAQSLTALKMDALWARDHLQDAPGPARERIGSMLALLDTAVASTRRIAADLRPLLLDDLGLAAAIEWLAHQVTQRTGLPCEVDVDEDVELGEPFASAIFRIVQESLNNAAKHAQASCLAVRLKRDAQALRLCVEDDGAGFDPLAPRKRGSLGLMGLRERAQLLGGRVDIESAPGRGTRLCVVIPLGAVEEGH